MNGMNCLPPAIILPLFFYLTVVPDTFVLATQDDAQFFESKIRPLLVARCYPCHSQDKKQEGGLHLDSKEGWQHGGDSGPAIVPGDPSKSLLLERVQSDSKQTLMPPSNAGPPLTAQQIADLAEWIGRGAMDPRMPSQEKPSSVDWDATFQARMKWWSLQPLRVIQPPEVNDEEWSHTLVDKHLRKVMEDHGVQLSNEPIHRPCYGAYIWS